MNQVVVLAEAAEDIGAARDFYEAQQTVSANIVWMRYWPTRQLWRMFRKLVTGHMSLVTFLNRAKPHP